MRLWAFSAKPRLARAGRPVVRAATSRAFEDRAVHNEHQASIFDSKVKELGAPQPASVVSNLQTIVAAANLPPGARVMDVGTGTGVLIPFFRDAGAEDVLAVDVSTKMLEHVDEKFGASSVSGNQAAVRTWHGDICDVPIYQGPADAIFFNAMFGNVFDQHLTLFASSSLLKPGGKIVISHPLGRAWLMKLAQRHPDMVPNSLPDRPALEQLIHDLPLQVQEVRDEKGLYCAVLQVPLGYTFPGAPLRLQGRVVHGQKRGSKEMGVPTANVEHEDLESQISVFPKGVYFGWCQVEGHPGVHAMVLNYGVRPSFQDGSNITVEAHVLHEFPQDFYDHQMKLLVVGYIRPEVPFSGVASLLDRIKLDIGLARSNLKSDEALLLRDDDWVANPI